MAYVQSVYQALFSPPPNRGLGSKHPSPLKIPILGPSKSISGFSFPLSSKLMWEGGGNGRQYVMEKIAKIAPALSLLELVFGIFQQRLNFFRRELNLHTSLFELK